MLETLRQIITQSGYNSKKKDFHVDEMAVLNQGEFLNDSFHTDLMFVYSIGQIFGHPMEFGSPVPRNPSLDKQSTLPFHIETDEHALEFSSEKHDKYLYRDKCPNGRMMFYYKIPEDMGFRIEGENGSLVKIIPEEALERYNRSKDVLFAFTAKVEKDEMKYISEFQSEKRYIDVLTSYFGYPTKLEEFDLYGVPRFRSKALQSREYLDPGTKAIEMCLTYEL